METVKEEVLVSARSYVVSLLEDALGDVRVTMDIVQGMSCFDPHVLLSQPYEQVS